jgi:hypothetical protein
MASLAKYGAREGNMPSNLIRMSAHVRRPQQFLWPDRIPLGSLTLVEGDPGQNKSSLVYDIAARVTSGRPQYGSDQPQLPANVMLLQAEDALDIIYNRLEAYGADISRVLAYDRHGEPLVLPGDIPWLEAQVREQQVRFLAIDPVMNFLTGNANNYQAVQRVVGPLAAMAERTGIALVLVRHLNKSCGANPLYRGAGSIGWMSAARSGLLVATDPTDPSRRVLAQTKSNVNTRAESLSFRPVERGGSVAIDWVGVVPFSATALLDTTSGESRSQVDQAMYFLYVVLSGGPVLQNEVYAMARREGFRDRSVRRAMENLRVESFHRGYQARFWWRLPEDDATYVQQRERMQTELATEGWRYEDVAVPNNEDAEPDDEGVEPDTDGAEPIGGVTPTVDNIPSGDNVPVPETITLPRHGRAILRRPMR